MSCKRDFHGTNVSPRNRYVAAAPATIHLSLWQDWPVRRYRILVVPGLFVVLCLLCVAVMLIVNRRGIIPDRLNLSLACQSRPNYTLKHYP